MKEIEEREEQNIRAQIRFINDAAEDNVEILVHLSCLDDSPVASEDGYAFGIVKAFAPHIRFAGGRGIILPGLATVVPLQHVFALSCRGEGIPSRSLVVLDTPSQVSAAADMFNNDTIRELLPEYAGVSRATPHPNHRDILPGMRRAAMRVVSGGTSCSDE